MPHLWAGLGEAEAEAVVEAAVVTASATVSFCCIASWARNAHMLCGPKSLALHRLSISSRKRGWGSRVGSSGFVLRRPLPPCYGIIIGSKLCRKQADTHGSEGWGKRGGGGLTERHGFEINPNFLFDFLKKRVNCCKIQDTEIQPSPSRAVGLLMALLNMWVM